MKQIQKKYASTFRDITMLTKSRTLESFIASVEFFISAYRWAFKIKVIWKEIFYAKKKTETRKEKRKIK